MSIKLYDAEIEYLESDGNAYIDTGIIGSQNTDYEVKTMFTKNTSYPYIFGAQQANKERRFSLMEGSYRTFYYVANDDTLESNISLSSAEQTGINIIKKIGRKVYVNNSLKVTWAATDYTTPATITLYAVNYAGGVGGSNRFRNGKIYYIKFYESNVLVRDFIPVRVGNVGYMYDRVSGQLFGNSGTGSFVLGPDVAPAAYANEIAFLESTGSQYIDTGVIPDSTTNINIEFETTYLSGDNGNFIFGCRVAVSSKSLDFLQYKMTTKQTFRFDYGDTQKNMNDVSSGWHNVYTIGADINIDGTSYSSGGTWETTTLPIYLFAINQNGSVSGLHEGLRVKTFKITSNDTLVRDFIPVEYNNIGYMYDKVSGQFFANQGTGKFVLGHRAPRFDGKACARSYTRRQLMGGLIQELEYLEYPNAGVRFVSDYIPQGKDNVFHYKFKLIGYNGNQSFDSWIYSRASRGDSGYNYRLMASTSGWYLTVQNGRAGNATSQNRNTVSAGTIYEYYVYKNQYYTINGTRYTYIDANCTGTNDCFLSIVDNSKKCKGRFYFLKWWKGDTLVLDWVPAIIDGNICIYDKLNKKILTRIGAGLVTAGPTIGWF